MTEEIDKKVENQAEEIEAEVISDEQVSEDADVSETTDPCEEVNNRYLRLLADFDNYKRRTIKEKEDIYKYANVGLLEQILPILDACDMSEKSLPSELPETMKGYVDGVRNIIRELNGVLEKSGLERIHAVGQAYDPAYHEAIMVVDDETVPPHTIIDEMRTGYQYKERIIRPTVCRVSSDSNK